jgi:hypothetical protein
MRKDMWDLDVTGMKSRHALPRWDIRHWPKRSISSQEAKADFDVAMKSLFIAQSPALLHGATADSSRA